MSFLNNLFGKKVKEEEIVELEAKYKAFWDWFTIHEATLAEATMKREHIVEEVLDIVGPKLKEIDPHFTLLVGINNEDKAELIITPDGRLATLPFADDLVAMAPKLDNWNFISCKPGIQGIGIEMSGYLFNEDTISFISIRDNAYPDYIHLRFIVEGYTEDKEEEIGNALYIFLDNYLGEELTMTMIDYLDVRGKESVTEELIPITKLRDYLIYREAEFVEKYDSVIRESDSDNYSILQAGSEEERFIIVINSTFLNWEQKMSYPWVVAVNIKYSGNEDGLPEKVELGVMEEIEDLIVETGVVHRVARETGANERVLYFGTKDFREASREVFKTINLFTDQYDIQYSIYKDKYWMGLESYTNAVNKG